ncbi:MAG: GNAT family N-acetyltransferase [Planctomycetes bacterium]|nr:GNAT family N-acetyltransferase [Planctomycetota bacterium]
MSEASAQPAEALAFRPMRRSDLPRVLEIERLSFRLPWAQDRFLSALERQSGQSCVVMEAPRAPGSAGGGTEVAGYFVLEIRAASTHILNLAIHPACRRRGLASRCLAFIEQMALKVAAIARERDIALHPVGGPDGPSRARGEASAGLPRESEISLEVEESNLPAQLLYRKMGYRATEILHNHYPELREDGYRMVRKVPLRSAGGAPR